MSIIAPAGVEQAQAMGVVSFPIPYKKGETPAPTYKNEKEVGTPKAPCNGNVIEPLAEPGHLCVYQAGNHGSLLTEVKNAEFVTFQEANGEGTPSLPMVGRLGALLVFRTAEFEEEEPLTLKNEAHLVLGGSWAVTGK